MNRLAKYGGEFFREASVLIWVFGNLEMVLKHTPDKAQNAHLFNGELALFGFGVSAFAAVLFLIGVAMEPKK